MTTRRKRADCSMCGGLRDRAGQPLCRKCHAEFMKDWRVWRVYVKRKRVGGSHAG